MSEISIDQLLLMIVSVPNDDKNSSGEIHCNIQYYQVYTVYANTNMAGTRIVYLIYTVNLGGARSALVA